jgi:hypothetical protein
MFTLVFNMVINFAVPLMFCSSCSRGKTALQTMCQNAYPDPEVARLLIHHRGDVNLALDEQ